MPERDDNHADWIGTKGQAETDSFSKPEGVCTKAVVPIWEDRVPDDIIESEKDPRYSTDAHYHDSGNRDDEGDHCFWIGEAPFRDANARRDIPMRDECPNEDDRQNRVTCGEHTIRSDAPSEIGPMEDSQSTKVQPTVKSIRLRPLIDDKREDPCANDGEETQTEHRGNGRRS